MKETADQRRERCTNAAILRIAEMTAKLGSGKNKREAQEHLKRLREKKDDRGALRDG